MVSCVRLDTVIPNARPRLPSSRQDVCSDGQESRLRQARRSTQLQGNVTSKQMHGTTSSTGFIGGVRRIGELDPNTRKGQWESGVNDNGSGDGGGVDAYPKQGGQRRSEATDRNKRRIGRSHRGGDTPGNESGRNGGGCNRATGRNLMNPFTIDLKEEVRGPCSIGTQDMGGRGILGRNR